MSHICFYICKVVCLTTCLCTLVNKKKNSDVMFIVKLVKTRLTILRSLENNINKKIAYVTDYRTYLSGNRPCGRCVL